MSGIRTDKRKDRTKNGKRKGAPGHMEIKYSEIPVNEVEKRILNLIEKAGYAEESERLIKGMYQFVVLPLSVTACAWGLGYALSFAHLFQNLLTNIWVAFNILWILYFVTYRDIIKPYVITKFFKSYMYRDKARKLIECGYAYDLQEMLKRGHDQIYIKRSLKYIKVYVEDLRDPELKEKGKRGFCYKIHRRYAPRDFGDGQCLDFTLFDQEVMNSEE